MKDILKTAKVSQAEFAKLVGVSRVTVNYWIADPPKAKPHPAFESKIKKWLDAIQAAVKAKTLPVHKPRGASLDARVNSIKRAVLYALG